MGLALAESDQLAGIFDSIGNAIAKAAKGDDLGKALAVAGGAVGTAIGGPAGTAIGAAAGNAVGGAIKKATNRRGGQQPAAEEPAAAEEPTPAPAPAPALGVGNALRGGARFAPGLKLAAPMNRLRPGMAMTTRSGSVDQAAPASGGNTKLLLAAVAVLAVGGALYMNRKGRRR
jgi:hypothetical protein